MSIKSKITKLINSRISQIGRQISDLSFRSTDASNEIFAQVVRVGGDGTIVVKGLDGIEYNVVNASGQYVGVGSAVLVKDGIIFG